MPASAHLREERARLERAAKQIEVGAIAVHPDYIHIYGYIYMYMYIYVYMYVYVQEEMCLVDAHLAEQGSKLEEVYIYIHIHVHIHIHM
jgi:hypothetical protein